jgi:hypothetical protein
VRLVCKHAKQVVVAACPSTDGDHHGRFFLSMEKRFMSRMSVPTLQSLVRGAQHNGTQPGQTSFRKSIHSVSYNKTKQDAPVSQIYSWNKTLHVSDSSSVHHQEFFTVHTAMVYVIQVCWKLYAPAHKLSANVYDIYQRCVYSGKTPDDGQKNCPKHVEFHSKNKFEKLVQLVGFIIRNLSRCTVTWTSNPYTQTR